MHVKLKFVISLVVKIFSFALFFIKDIENSFFDSMK
jgi:hypothetical protein